LDILNGILAYPINQLPFVIIALAISLSFHEFAHAYSAYRFGDETAYNEGRVTLDPRKHLDVFGTIFILIAGFGWAKPVPVNRNKFKQPRAMGVVVSAVGPLSNLMLAVIAIAIIVVLDRFGFQPHASGVNEAINVFLGIFLQLNLVLFIFNLIPLPPLDGYRIVEDLAPLKARYWMQQHAQWGMFIFLLMIFIGPIRNVTISPLMFFTYELSVKIYNVFQWIVG
jgi:Zn-dependent protease